MVRISRALLALLAALALSGALAVPALADLYWVNGDGNTIGHSANNGSGANAAWLASPDDVGGGVAADATSIYWTGWAGQIWRANRDGTGVQEVVSTADNPTGLAVDGQHLYWANANYNTIGRANTDGSAVDNGFIATGVQPDSVVVTATHVYWANFGDGTIGRANLDGTGVDNAFITGLDANRGLVTDGQHLYWTEFYEHTIGRANIDGTGVDRSWSDVGYYVHSLAMAGGAVYWTEPQDGYIGLKVPFSSTEGYVTDSAGFPMGIVATGAGWRQPTTSGAFGNANTNVGGAGPTRTFTVTNAGPGRAVDPLTFAAGAVTITGTNANQFTKTADTCSGTSVAAGASCTVTVRFNPTSTGAKSAALRFADNAVTSPQTVSLSGRGTAPAFSVSPSSLALGSVTVGDTGLAQTVTVTNSSSGANAGTLTIPVGGVTLTGTDAGQFTITADDCAGQTLAPAATCTVSVALAPSSTGAKSATLRFADNASGNPHTVALSGTAMPAAPPVAAGRPVITGDLQPGQTLTASPGTWSGSPPTSYAYQWRRCNVDGSVCTEVGLDTDQYLLTGGDVGFYLRVSVIATNAGGSTPQRSMLTAGIGMPVGTGKPAVTGVPQPGQALTTTAGTWDGAPSTYSYQWRRCDTTGEACVPVGSDADTYVLGADDVGARMRVTVTATNAAGSAPQRSVPTALIGRPVAEGRPEITGSLQPGETLGATTGSWDGGAVSAYTYVWWRCDDAGTTCTQVGGDTATYVLAPEDTGSRMRVSVTASNAAGATPQRSGLTGRVGLPVPAGKPVISGATRAGQALSTTLGAWTGGAADTYAYSWRRCNAAGEECVEVGTAAAYQLTPSDVGSRIRVTITATNAAGNGAQRSDPTRVVAAA